MRRQLPPASDATVHQRQLTAALVTGAEHEKERFVQGILGDDALLAEAVVVLRGHWKTWPSKWVQTLSPEGHALVQRAVSERLEALLGWDSRQSSLARWLGRQAYWLSLQERRFLARGEGYWRATGQYFGVCSLEPDPETGLSTELAAPRTDIAEALPLDELRGLLRGAADRPAAGWLDAWLHIGALHDQPLKQRDHQIKLSWRHGMQRQVASSLKEVWQPHL